MTENVVIIFSLCVGTLLVDYLNCSGRV